MGLCAALVTEREQDGRIRRLAILRQIQVGSDVQSGLALEDNFFDAVLITLQHAHHFGIERCALREVRRHFAGSAAVPDRGAH